MWCINVCLCGLGSLYSPICVSAMLARNLSVYSHFSHKAKAAVLMFGLAFIILVIHLIAVIVVTLKLTFFLQERERQKWDALNKKIEQENERKKKIEEERRKKQEEMKRWECALDYFKLDYYIKLNY